MKKAIHIDEPRSSHFTQVKEAVMLANQLLRNDTFYEQIAAHPAFDHADVSPATVAQMMREARLNMTLDLYYSLSPIKNIDGYDDHDDPTVIHINVWKTDRSPASICNTIVHACIHAVNAHNRQYSFGHGDDTLAGKENTAPYWIGALAQRLTDAEDTVIIPLEHDPHEPRVRTSKAYAGTAMAGAR